jgi:hypothetical protein
MYRLALIVLLAAACGPSATTLETARYARYDTSFSTVWNVVVEEVRSRYPSLTFEDAVTGRIATNWRLVDTGGDDPANRTSANTKATMGQNGPLGSQVQTQSSTLGAAPGVPLGITEANLVRVMVHVKGPPWTVNVEGQGAHYEPGLKLSTYQRGAIDEPPWVQTRVDNLTAGIYEKLKQYAMKTEAAKQVAKPVDTTAWNNVQDKGAVACIGGVRHAAASNDTRALRGFMASDFRWADGAEGSAETALAMWSADPSALRAIANTLDSGCAADAASGDVVCSGKQAVARFHQVTAGWKFVEFTAR